MSEVSISASTTSAKAGFANTEFEATLPEPVVPESPTSESPAPKEPVPEGTASGSVRAPAPATGSLAEGTAPPPREAGQAAGDWDGPLDLLLAHARAHRIDLAALSMTALVDRCLALLPLLPMAQKADQIGLAAELTELKSRLLLPRPAVEEGDEALRLRRRLEHLILIRQAADALTAREQLGRDMFVRGMPEMEDLPPTRAPLDLMDLIRTYARLRLAAEADAPLEVRRILVLTMGEALAMLGGQLSDLEDWTPLAPLMRTAGKPARSTVAASFMAALEMARQGEVEIRQDGAGVAVRRR